ncbi:unnamed protein product [Sphagnum troendelagicum]|uniref:Uncharacterized protein n=1 Tax=Sphagnum troendelagicum TaxID=128251 RepID=A0ABP0UMU0_9BRYO
MDAVTDMANLFPSLSFDCQFLCFLVLVCRSEGKKGLELIPFLIWRKTGTKYLKTIKFLELHGRVLRLVLSRFAEADIVAI